MQRSINLIYDDVENVRMYAEDSEASLPIRTKYRINGSLFAGGFSDGWFEVIGSYGLFPAVFSDIEDVQKYPERKFYYILDTGTQLKEVINQIGGLPLTDVIKDCLRNFNNLKVILLNPHESDSPDVLSFLDEKIIEEGLNTEQFYLVNNNYKLKENKKILGSKINVHTIKYLPKGNLAYMSRFKHEIQNGKLFNFMCFNRNPGAHRIILLCMLKEKNLLDCFDWSLLRGFRIRYLFEKEYFGAIDLYLGGILDKTEFTKYTQDIKYFTDLGTKKSQMEEYLEIKTDVQHNDLPGEKIFSENPYQKSYINVTTESDFYNEVIHITEKTFIPFYFFQLPIIVGNYQMVKKIREEFGFDFFDDFIDHSYDDEPNHKKRLEMIVDEIERLNTNPEKIKEFYINNNDRLIRNNQICLEIAKGKTDDVDFFNSLLD